MSEVRFYPDRRDTSYYEHMHRYLFAGKYTAGKKVLDISCGEGYGTAILSREAQSAAGCDIDEDIISLARKKYGQSEKLSFVQGDFRSLPFGDNSFDVVVSYETIEHISGQDLALTEIKRVLRDDGLLIMSTPDRRVYSDERDYHNPEHVKEFYREEFRAFLKEYFCHIREYGQRFMRADFITEDSSPLFRMSEQVTERPDPMYIILLAGDTELPDLSGNSLFMDSRSDDEILSAKAVILDKDRQIRDAEQVISSQREQLTAAAESIDGKNEEIRSAKAVISDKDEQIRNAERIFSSQREQLAASALVIEEKDKEIEEAGKAIAGVRLELEQLKENIRILEKVVEDKNSELQSAKLVIDEKDRELKDAKEVIDAKESELITAREILKCH